MRSAKYTIKFGYGNYAHGAGVAQLVERVLAKHKVVSSKLITRFGQKLNKINALGRFPDDLARL